VINLKKEINIRRTRTRTIRKRAIAIRNTEALTGREVPAEALVQQAKGTAVPRNMGIRKQIKARVKVEANNN